MKVLYITNGFFGSNEANMIQSHNTVSALCAEGSVGQVCFIAHTDKTPELKTLTKEHENATDSLSSLKLQFSPVVINRNSWVKTLYALYQTLKSINYKEYDVVYTRSREALVLLFMLGFKKFSFEAHALKYPSSPYKEVLYNVAIKYGRMNIVSINQTLQDDFKSIYNINPSRLSLIPCSARTSLEVSLPLQDRRFIVFCGSSYPGKGLDEFVKLSLEYPQYDFLAISRSSQYLEDTISLAGDNLSVKKDLSNKQVYKYLANSYIAFAPYSKEAQTSGGESNARYLSPLKIFEYMSMGCLIISSDLDSIQEVITNGESACLYQADNYYSLKDAFNHAFSLIQEGEAEGIVNSALYKFQLNYSYTARAKMICASVRG